VREVLREVEKVVPYITERVKEVEVNRYVDRVVAGPAPKAIEVPVYVEKLVVVTN
jgi:hypothetical protein